MFSLAQRLTYYGPTVDAAWLKHCDRECITDSTAASKKEWERDQLKSLFGVDSTKTLNKGKHFDRAMAHFEELADNGSIAWQMNWLKGDAKRAQYQLTETIRLMHFKADYIAAIAERMGIPHALQTDKLTAEDAIRLKIALTTHVGRRQAEAVNEHQNPELPNI